MPHLTRTAVLLALLGTAQPLSAQQHPMTLADLPLLQGVSNPALSPDGESLAYVRSSTDYDANRSSSDVVLVSTSDGGERVIAAGSSPKWSPDGTTIALLGSEGGRRGIVLYEVRTGQTRFLAPVHVTDHHLGRVSKNFEWSPDGTQIAYLGAEPPNPSPPTSDVMAFDRILYKTRTSFSDNRRTHVWLVPVAGGEPRVLTPGDYDEHSISWSPDGTKIAFISSHAEDPDDNYRDDLWTVDVALGVMTQLTETLGTEFQPAWSPDGGFIAYRATTRSINTKDSQAEDSQLWVIAADGGAASDLTGKLDRRVSEIAWHPDSHQIYFTAGDRGVTAVYRVPAEGGAIERVTAGENQVRQYSIDGRGRTMAYVASDMTHPPEIWLADVDGNNARQLTNVHKSVLEQVLFQDAETFWFDSFDGTPIQGWLMQPVGFREGLSYPLVLYIHGGPHGMYGYGFSLRFQLLAAEGYAILFINPRGSSGYGQRFADGTLLNWGGGDYKDLMAGVDHALVRYSWLDEDRLGVIGGSYGGYMTNWVITQTNRFKAAVTRASVSNLISFYGTSLYQLLIEVEFNGRAYDNYPLLWQWSPLAHVKNVTTPTLFLHGVNDHDVPITQAEEMYIALRKLGVEATLVRYPGEGHGIRGPQHQLDFNRRISDWFNRFLKQGTAAAGTP
jgi:dipeptidyl aminopeptidase/acylaminoacyl peptidase